MKDRGQDRRSFQFTPRGGGNFEGVVSPGRPVDSPNGHKSRGLGLSRVCLNVGSRGYTVGVLTHPQLTGESRIECGDNAPTLLFFATLLRGVRSKEEPSHSVPYPDRRDVSETVVSSGNLFYTMDRLRKCSWLGQEVIGLTF